MLLRCDPQMKLWSGWEPTAEVADEFVVCGSPREADQQEVCMRGPAFPLQFARCAPEDNCSAFAVGSFASSRIRGSSLTLSGVVPPVRLRYTLYPPPSRSSNLETSR